MGQIKGNTDGASAGNPGPSGIGISFRDYKGEFLTVIYQGIGIMRNYWAECLAILTAAEFAVLKEWKNIWLESDSSVVVAAFNSGKVPCQFKNRWLRCKAALENISISQIWREANLVADQASKMGVLFQNDFVYVCNEKPEWVRQWEVPYGGYSGLS
ncbi:hypothetical protein ACHQM5_010153 [Ranunculus cassubicifolius]